MIAYFFSDIDIWTFKIYVDNIKCEKCYNYQNVFETEEKTIF